MLLHKQMLPSARNLVIHDLGLVEYEDGLALQKAFALARKNKSVSDSLLLLEHPPVITLGRAADMDHVVAPREKLERAGVVIFPTDRGGDVTYHGPGQLVGYPIIDLSPDRCDVRRYVRDLEEAMIATVGDFGLTAGRIEGWNGAWLGEKGKDARKIGAIGVHISRWVTTHGFALNVEPDMAHFRFIVPCGIGEAGVTSIARELGRSVPLAEVRRAMGENFSRIFDARRSAGRFDHRTISVTVLRQRAGGFEALLLLRHPHRGGFWQPVTGTIETREEPLSCAQRELLEESGFVAEVKPLNYVHSFLFGEPRADRPPRVYQETAFWTLVSGEAPITLDPREHVDHAWVPVEQAIARVPFAGLKEAMRRAVRLAREPSSASHG